MRLVAGHGEDMLRHGDAACVARLVDRVTALTGLDRRKYQKPPGSAP